MVRASLQDAPLMVSCATDAIHSFNSSNAQFQTFTHASSILLQSISSLIKLSPFSFHSIFAHLSPFLCQYKFLLVPRLVQQVEINSSFKFIGFTAKTKKPLKWWWFWRLSYRVGRLVTFLSRDESQEAFDDDVDRELVRKCTTGR